jgi:hypothetical protein
VKLTLPKRRPSRIPALLLVGALFAAVPTGAQSAKPFDGLEGAWSGTGVVTLGSGDKERIRCRVTYELNNNGNSVEQDLRCASDSYKFDLSANINYVNGAISGYWSETNRKQNGTITGRATAGEIRALAETPGFSAFLTLVTRGNQQSVKIESKSTEITEVAITLRKGR